MMESVNPLDAVDREERRIFRQSLPKEEITRDFLLELLREHQAASPSAGWGAAGADKAHSPPGRQSV